MENPKIDPITDIRQSEEWGEYLKFLGWKKYSLGRDKNLHLLKTGPLKIAKMQRPQNLDSQEIKDLDSLACKEKLAFIKLEPALDQNLEDLANGGYKHSSSPLCPPSTIFIELKNSIEKLEGSLSHSAKYSINRAKREGGVVEFHPQPSNEILSRIYPDLRNTAIRQKFFVPSLEDLQVKAHLWKSNCHVAIAKNSQGTIQGSKMFLGFRNNVWFLHGGTSEEARKTKFGYLLLWESILYLKRQRFNILDLEGRDDKRFPAFTNSWGGFSHFKEKFGGINVQYPYPMIKCYSPIFKGLSYIYKSALPL